MKEPKGEDLLATLIRLLEEQEGVKITYETRRETNIRTKETDSICPIGSARMVGC